MRKRKAALENLARHTSLAFFFFFLLTSWMLAAEPPVLSVAAHSSPGSFSTKDSVNQLLAEKSRHRTRAIEKESLLKAMEERVQNLENEAEAACKTKNFFLARKRVRQILLYDPHYYRALKLLRDIQKAEHGKQPAKLSFELFKEEVPFITGAEKEKMIAFFLKRGKTLLRKKRYDDAVDEIENVFVLDPLNAQASQLIDQARETLIREKRMEWKGRAAQADENFSEKMELSFHTIKRLIEAREYMQARVILNRMAFMEPDNKEIRKFMEQIQQLERKEAEKKAA